MHTQTHTWLHDPFTVTTRHTRTHETRKYLHRNNRHTHTKKICSRTHIVMRCLWCLCSNTRALCCCACPSRHTSRVKVLSRVRAFAPKGESISSQLAAESYVHARMHTNGYSHIPHYSLTGRIPMCVEYVCDTGIADRRVRPDARPARASTRLAHVRRL